MVFQIGDAVRYISNHGQSNGELIVGESTGTVVIPLDDPKSWNHCVGVEWDVSPRPPFHKLSGKLSEDRGYFVNPEQIEIVAAWDPVPPPPLDDLMEGFLC